MGLKQADQFLGSRHRLIGQDTPLRLVNDLFQTGQEGLTDVDEPSSLLPGASLDGCQDLLHLFDRGPCYLEEMTVVGLDDRFSQTSAFGYLAGRLFGTARPIAEQPLR